MWRMILFLAAVSAFGTADDQAPGPMTDLALLDGTVWTGNPAGPWAEAVLIRGERFFRTGSSAEIRKLAIRGARVIDLRGALVLPGFIDSHAHFLNGGFVLSSVQLRRAGSRREFASLVKAKAGELGKDAWILGGDWDHEQFETPELPRRDWIDDVTPRNPVFVNRLDGHMGLANGRALAIAGITKDTPAPPGGEIVKDPATGEPTGILKDAAMDLVLKHVPEPSFRERLAAAEAALRHAVERGVTSVHEMADAASLEVYRHLLREGKLTARLSVYIPITEVDAVSRLRLKSPFGNELLKLAGLKGFVDGSLGSATACFFEPYLDNPATSGLLHEQMLPEGIMEERLLKADKEGLQVAVHAIGDRANSLILGIFEKVIGQKGPRDRRWRIEHAQHIRPEDQARMGKLGIIGSVQPYHAIDDGRWAEKRIGKERCSIAYPFRTLLDGGVRLAMGSDWTVAPLDPLAGIGAAVTRRTLDGKNPGGWFPEQKITVEEAVRGYTLDAAFAEFSEGLKGTIEAGKLADCVVLDRNIFRIPREEIRDARVRLTIFNGKIIYGER